MKNQVDEFCGQRTGLSRMARRRQVEINKNRGDTCRQELTAGRTERESSAKVWRWCGDRLVKFEQVSGENALRPVGFIVRIFSVFVKFT